MARGRFRYSDPEWAVIVVAATLAEMPPNAWAQQAAYEAALHASGGATTDRDTVRALEAELRQHRRVLTNVGGNLNDIARVANSTHEIAIAAAAQSVLRLVGNAVRASDTLVRDIRARLLP
jgi:hypothetical protein